MRYFQKHPPDRLMVPAHLLQAFRTIGEYKGKQDLYQEQSSQTLAGFAQAEAQASRRSEQTQIPIMLAFQTLT